MLYIDRKPIAKGTLLKVTGVLFGEGVEEFQRACRSSPRPLSLDLSDLREVDSNGLLAIRKQKLKGASLTRVSLYLEALLGDGAEGEPLA